MKISEFHMQVYDHLTYEHDSASGGFEPPLYIRFNTLMLYSYQL